MDHKAVIFSKNGAKILHGIDPEDYRGRKDVLIDPAFPPGIPPHQWMLSGDKIKGTLGSYLPPSSKRLAMKYIAALALGALIMFLVKR